MGKFLTVIMLLGGLVVGSVTAEEPQLLKFIPHGGGPKWTPDGKYLSFYQNRKLHLYDLAGDSIFVAGAFFGNKFEWLNDSQVVFMSLDYSGVGRSRERKAIVKFMTVGSIDRGIEFDSTREYVSSQGSPPGLFADGAGTVALVTSDSTVILSQFGTNRGAKQTRFFRAAVNCLRGHFGREKPDSADTDIWLLGFDGKQLRRVTYNKEYMPPMLSPNGLLLYAGNAGGYTVIMDTSGNELASLYLADDECWASDSRTLYYSVSIEDGHDMLGGDLFCYSLETDSITQLTFTKDIAEFKPRVSPDGTMLAYRTYHKDPEGIEILILK